MAWNKNALVRYKTIDRCLQNNNRKWALEDLISACSDALYEYEGRDNCVSKRTVQLDIQMMRSDKLGYNAPIVVYERKYYQYQDPNYSIANVPLTKSDIEVLMETVDMLKQFKDFSLLKDLGGIIQRLEDKIYTEKTNNRAVIHLEYNNNLKGLRFLDELYRATIKKVVLRLTYKSFRMEKENKMIFHPYLLKEFNNRWFLIGKMDRKIKITNLALDRIEKIDYDFKTAFCKIDFDADQYYKDVIGVSMNPEDPVYKVKIWLNKQNAPYVITKPIHHSQKVIRENSDGSIIVRIKVKLNLELERRLLGFGEGLKVLKPKVLREKIQSRLIQTVGLYDVDFND